LDQALGLRHERGDASAWFRKAQGFSYAWSGIASGACLEAACIFSYRASSGRQVTTLTSRHLTRAGADGVLGSASPRLSGSRCGTPTSSSSLPRVLVSRPGGAAAQDEEFLRENLNAMAVKLGEMQAQLCASTPWRAPVGTGRLKPENSASRRPAAAARCRRAAQGSLDAGVQPAARPAVRIWKTAPTRWHPRSQLFDAKVKKKLMPTIRRWTPPTRVLLRLAHRPFNGMLAMHEGWTSRGRGHADLRRGGRRGDYSGPIPVRQPHRDRSRHDFTTRYAHCSRLLVKEARSCSAGSRSPNPAPRPATGPHLHFEVRYRGVSQNPIRFLQASSR